jgi:acyl-CoA synthetase (AMP-forming)/AMP-acid ligase II
MSEIDKLPKPTSLSESTGGPLSSPLPSLYDLFNAPALKHPSRTALICMHQPVSFLSSHTTSNSNSTSNPTTPPSSPPPYLHWTFTHLSTASHTLSQSLLSSGILPGNRIAAFVHNSAEWHILFRAALELHCIFAPLNPKTANHAAEVRHVMEMLYPSVVLVQDRDVARKLEEYAGESLGKRCCEIVFSF